MWMNVNTLSMYAEMLRNETKIRLYKKFKLIKIFSL